jgi:transposase InsO family protein
MAIQIDNDHDMSEPAFPGPLDISSFPATSPVQQGGSPAESSIHVQLRELEEKATRTLSIALHLARTNEDKEAADSAFQEADKQLALVNRVKARAVHLNTGHIKKALPPPTPEELKHFRELAAKRAAPRATTTNASEAKQGQSMGASSSAAAPDSSSRSVDISANNVRIELNGGESTPSPAAESSNSADLLRVIEGLAEDDTLRLQLKQRLLESKQPATIEPPKARMLKQVPELTDAALKDIVSLLAHADLIEESCAARGYVSAQDYVSNFHLSAVRHQFLCRFLRNLVISPSTTVADVKKAIISHLCSSAAGRALLVSNARQKLVMKAEEDVAQFAERYERVLKMVGVDINSYAAKDDFIKALRPPLLFAKLRERIYAADNDVERDFASVVRMAVRLSAVLGAEEPSLEALVRDKPKGNPRKVYLGPPREKSDHTSSNSQPASPTTSGDSSTTSSERDHAASPAKPRSAKTCSHCHKRGHEESACWIKNPALREQASSKAERRKRQREEKSPTATAGETTASLHVLTTIAHPSLFSSDVIRQGVDEDKQGVPQPKSASEVNASPDGDDDLPLLATVQLNDKSVEVYCDTGASHGFITANFANKHRLHYHKTVLWVVMPDQQKFRALGVTDPVLIQHGLHMALVRFVVVKHLAHAEAYLSKRQLIALKMIVLNLGPPAAAIDESKVTPTANTLVQEESIREDEDAPTPVHPDDEQRVMQFREELQPLLDANARITGFAVAPEVKLNLMDETPKFVHQYPLPEQHKPAVREQVAKWLAKGKIQRVQASPWNLPLTTAIKRDENGNQVGVRVCLDPRTINARLVSDSWTIPNIQQICDSFSGMAYFTEIDLEDAFLQLKIRDCDQQTLSFTFEGQQYSFVGAPYGLRVMSEVFQRTISGLFTDLGYVRVYIDNLIVASRTWEEHCVHVRTVLERLNKLNLKVSQKKLKLGRRSIRLLGREISREGVRPDPSKVEKIMKWPFPADHKALQSFLGVVNFLRPHIRDLPELQAALNAARDSQAAYERQVATNKEAMLRSFELLKEAISKLPLCRFPDFNRTFFLACDASRIGIGAVLYQPSDRQLSQGDNSVTADNIVRIVSRSLHKYEKNYAVYKLETLALVYALREFRLYLLGKRFHVLTDHRALTFILNLDKNMTQPINSTLSGWAAELLEYEFDVTHVPGYRNLLPDHLSRIYARTSAWGVDNLLAKPTAKKAPKKTEDVEAVPPCTEENELPGPPPILSVLTVSDNKDDTTSKTELMRSLGKSIPAESERRAIVERVHAEGHYGVRTVVEKIYNHYNYWWPTLKRDTQELLKVCSTCQRFDVVKRGYHPMRSPDVALPHEWCQCDLIHMPTSVNGYQYILTIIDLFTSYLLTRPLKTATAAEVAMNLYQVWADWGPPRILQSDSGSEFVNEVLLEMAKVSGVELRVSTPHYKHSTGSVERVNRTIGTSLRKMLAGAIATWDAALPLVTHYYNTTVRSLTNTSPYALMFCRASTPFGRERDRD